MSAAAIDRARFVPYDTTEYPFARIVAEQVFGSPPPLERLHEQVPPALRGDREGEPLGYVDNLALRELLASAGDESELLRTYRRLVEKVLAPLFGGRISFSRRPTFRVHMAGTESVSNWHTDVEVTGRHDQINAWLPFTDAFGGGTIWVERDYGRGDFAPVDVSYGELLLFDGGWLSHGSVSNDTGTTRVSADFRFAPLRPDLPHPDLGILGGRPKAGYRPSEPGRRTAPASR